MLSTSASTLFATNTVGRHKKMYVTHDSARACCVEAQYGTMSVQKNRRGKVSTNVMMEKCVFIWVFIHLYTTCVCLHCIFFAVMSENYIVFIEQPIKLDLLMLMLHRIQGKGFNNCMKWEPHYDTIFHLVNRHTGAVRVPWFVPIDSLTVRSKRKKSWKMMNLHPDVNVRI